MADIMAIYTTTTKDQSEGDVINTSSHQQEKPMYGNTNMIEGEAMSCDSCRGKAVTVWKYLSHTGNILLCTLNRVVTLRCGTMLYIH